MDARVLTGRLVKGMQSFDLIGRLAPGDPSTTVRLSNGMDGGILRALFDEDRAEMLAALALPEPMLRQLLDQQFVARETGYGMAYPSAETLIIEHRGQPVGQMLVDYWREVGVEASVAPAGVAGHDKGGHVSIVDFGIAVAARGAGIGTDVLSGLIRAAREAGFAEVRLSVQAMNTAAARLYTRLGFRFRDDDSELQASRKMALVL